MKKNRILLALSLNLTVCLLSPVLLTAQNEIEQKEDLIVGEWFPLNTSRTGLSSGYTFTADGNFTAVSGAYVVFKYKHEGDTLIMTMPGDEQEVKQKIELTDTKLSLSQTGPDKVTVKVTELTRVSGDSKTGIIGKWTGDHYSGVKQTMYFTPELNQYFSLPMNSKEGTYKIKGNFLEFSGQEIKFQWSVNEDTLTLKVLDDEKTELKFVRF